MAFVATLGEVPRAGWLMFIVTVLWAGVYDTQYAMVDRDDDVKLGVHSTAIAFGDLDTVLIGVMQLMVLGGLLLVGRAAGLDWPFFASLGVAAALFLWQQWLIRHRERDGCFKAFLQQQLGGIGCLRRNRAFVTDARPASLTQRRSARFNASVASSSNAAPALCAVASHSGKPFSTIEDADDQLQSPAPPAPPRLQTGCCHRGACAAS